MPITLQIIRASEFIRVNAKELLDFESSKAVLQGLALACRKQGLDRAMMDLRDLPIPDKPMLTTEQLAALIRAFRDAGFSGHQRLAVLFHHDVHGRIRVFAFLSKMRGLQVEAFVNFEQAFLWLAEGEKDGAEEHPGVPVRIVRHQAKTRTEVLNAGTNRVAAVRGFHSTTK